jgi:hypothetical protein
MGWSQRGLFLAVYILKLRSQLLQQCLWSISRDSSKIRCSDPPRTHRELGGLSADQIRDLLSLVECCESRHGPDFALLRDLLRSSAAILAYIMVGKSTHGLLVHVHFDKFDLGVLCLELLEVRADKLAGTAPCRPEVGDEGGAGGHLSVSRGSG